MQLSELYNNQTETKKFYIEGSSSGANVSFTQSRRYIDMYTNKTDFDKSCVYTMCTDDSMNIVSQYKRYSCTVNHITVDFEQFKHDNAVIFNYWNNTDVISDFVLTNNKTMSGWLTLLTNVNVQNYVIYPKVWAVEKNNLTWAGDNYSCLSQSDIVLVSLKQLYENKDKYVVVDFNCKSYYILSNFYYMGVSIPYRTFFNDVYVTGGVLGCSNGTGFQTNKTAGSSTSYGQRGTGGVATSWIKGYNFDDTTQNYVFSCIYPLDIDNKKDNTYEIIEKENGGWIVKHGETSFACKHYWTADYILKLFASMGVYVVWDDILPTANENLKDSSHTAIGEMDKNGFTTGKMLTPIEKSVSESPNLNYNLTTNNIVDPDRYKPVKPDGDDITPPQYRITDQIGGFTMYYKCSQNDLLTIVQRVNFPDSVHPLPEGWEFAPHLVSCTQYPFNVSQYAGGHTSNVIIGSWDSGVNSISLTSTQLAVQTIANFTLEHKYNSFLDYSPYAQYQLFIPLCGWVDLPDTCVGKTITVDLATDVINNSCLATVNADGCPVVHKAGHMGTSVSLSVTENGLKQSALTQSLFNTIGAVTSTGYAVATQNPVGIVNGIASVAGAVYQGSIANNSNYTRQIGSTGDKSDCHVSNTCYLKKMYTVPVEPDNYSHTCGYPSDTSDKVNTFSGYNVFTNIDTSGLSCNQKQKEMIKSLLETGVYI